VLKIKSIWIYILTFACLVSVVMGCAPAPAQQTTPTPAAPQATTHTIVIGQLMDYSGPYKTQGAVFKAAADTFEKYYNEERGGTDGVKVKFVHYDFQNQASVATTAVKQGNLDSKPQAWVCAYSNAINAAKKQCLADQSLMVGLPNAQGLADPNSFVLITRPLYEEEFVGALGYLGSSWKGIGKMKWASVSIEGMPSAVSLTKSAAPISQQTNTEYLYTEWVPVAWSDPGPVVTKIASNMPDVLWIGHIDPGVALLMKAMAERDLLGKVTPYVTCHAGPSFVRKLTGNDIIDGLLVSSPYASYTQADKIPIMATAIKLLKQTAPELYPPDLLFMQAWVNYLTITEGTTLAAKKVGWDKLKSADIRDLLISGVKIDTGGLSQPLYWEGPSYSRALHSDQLVRETKTGEEVMSPWYKLVDWNKDIEKK